MKLYKTIAIVVLFVGLLVGGLSAGVFLSQRSLSAGVAPSAQAGHATHESGDVQDDNGDEPNEVDQAQSQTGVTSDEARAAAETGNPGTKALEVELEDENGTLVYEVELDNGLEVMVDAANGNILGTERDEDD
jgi:uncharacterized membrane protein YkoI